MKTLLSKLNIKVASSIGVSLFLVFAFSLALAPRTISTALADQTNCPPPPGFSSLPTSPLFNPYPVTVNGEAGINCEDSPTLSAGIHNSGTWSDSSVQANVGDTVSLRVYIHNGAASNSGAVMHNVAYNVNLDTSVGTSHAVTVQLTASNAAEKDGSVTINIPDGAHLEYSGGDPLHQNLGDQQPCFQYVQQFKITLIVVGGTVTPPNPPANSTASLSLNSTTFCVYSKNDGTNQIPTYTVTGSSNLGGQEVIWASTKNGVPTGESNDYYGQNLNSSGYWTGTGGAWTVNDIGSWTKTASIFANGKVSASSQPFAFTVKDCSGTTTTPPPTSSVTLSINLGTFCIYSKNDGVNQTPVYSVNGSSNLAGEDILWSSTKNGVSTGESNDYYNQKLDASGHYVSTNDSQPTRPWNNSDIGNWTKTASIFNSSVITATSQPVSFVVKDCSGATTNPTSLSCSASVASANIGDNVQFTAVGGNNTYTWATSNNTNAGSGSLFNVNFASGGHKLVSVTSNGQTANCGVFINTPGSTSSGNTTNTNTNISNNCVNYSCNNTSTNN